MTYLLFALFVFLGLAVVSPVCVQRVHEICVLKCFVHTLNILDKLFQSILTEFPFRAKTLFFSDQTIDSFCPFFLDLGVDE